MKKRLHDFSARPIARAGFCLLVLTFSSCQVLQQMISIQQPGLEAEKIRIRSMSFDAMDLALDVAVTNPNPVGVSLMGFDYNFQIKNASLLKGDQASKQTIAANGRTSIEIPVTLRFKDLYDAVQTLKNQDSAAYTIACGLSFDLPVLGRVRVPVSHSGNLPMVKLPRVKIQSLKLKRMGLTGADLELALGVANPNGFKVGLKRLNYDFAVNGLSWAKGAKADSVTIRDKSEQTVRIPLSLNFLQMGQTVSRLLSGDNALDCQLKGNLDMGTSIPAFGEATLPLDLAGKINLIK